MVNLGLWVHWCWNSKRFEKILDSWVAGRVYLIVRHHSWVFCKFFFYAFQKFVLFCENRRWICKIRYSGKAKCPSQQSRPICSSPGRVYNFLNHLGGKIEHFPTRKHHQPPFKMKKWRKILAFFHCIVRRFRILTCPSKVSTFFDTFSFQTVAGGVSGLENVQSCLLSGLRIVNPIRTRRNRPRARDRWLEFPPSKRWKFSTICVEFCLLIRRWWSFGIESCSFVYFPKGNNAGDDRHPIKMRNNGNCPKCATLQMGKFEPTMSADSFVSGSGLQFFKPVWMQDWTFSYPETPPANV
jgi:hypothetical protein